MKTMRHALSLGLGAALTLTVLGGPTSALAQRPPAGATTLRPYVLANDDQLDIAVAGHEELKASVTVLSDGTISVPQVGTVRAAGLTVEGLKRVLTKALSQTINQPDVTIGVHSAQVQKVSVLGAVKAPGQFPIKPEARLLDVVAAAGGFAQDAGLTQATLVSDGGGKSTIIDVPALMANADTAQNLPLSSGDVLLVQAREAPVYQVQVTGEVGKPGTYPVPKEGVPVLSLLTTAGGPQPDAALTEAQILHDGKVQTVNLRPLTSDLGSAVGNIRLLPGDVLQVPANVAKVALLGAVGRPGAYDMPDGGNLSATSALILAGGTSSDADMKNATLLRRDQNGQPVLLALNLASLLTGQTKDATLQPGDILYVPSVQPSKKINPLQLLSFIPLVNLFRH